MNVFQHLGLPVDHRPTGKVVQLVKDFESCETKLNKFFKDGDGEGFLLAQKKYDGVYAMAVCTEEYGDYMVKIFGRTGKKLTNVEHLEESLSSLAADELYAGVLIFELIGSGVELEQLSGIVNPNRVNPLDEWQESIKSNFRMAFHDCLTLPEFINGSSRIGYRKRHWRLCDLDVRSDCGFIVESVACRSLEACIEFSQACIDSGNEGAVLKAPEATWEAGRKNEVATKIVRGVDYDLEVVGLEEGKGKHANMVGKMILKWRMYGQPNETEVRIPVDGRFTQVQRKAWWDNPSSIVGKIVHVHALQLGSKGLLRLPKIRAVRIDKFEADL